MQKQPKSSPKAAQKQPHGKTAAAQKQPESSAKTALVWAAFAAIAYALWPRDPLTLENKMTRAIQFSSGLGFYYTGNVEISTVELPMVDFAHYRTQDLPDIKNTLADIQRKYGGIISAVGGMTRVPEELIKAFMYIESEGKASALSPAGAIGLMQIMPTTGVFILALENIKKRLTTFEYDWIKQIIGERMDCIKKMPNLGDEVVCRGIRKNAFLTREDLFNPELNIMLGAIYLGILLDESYENGNYRLDKVVVRYNMGYNAFKKGKTLVGSPNQVVALLPKEPASFVKKLVGRHGLLSLV